MIGIYLITCSVTGGRYVGASSDIEDRWSRHRRALRAQTHHARRLQADHDAHGYASLVFSVIEELAEPALLRLREAVWIKALAPEYNSTPSELRALYRAAKLANPVRFWLGKKRPPETGKKISAAQRGRVGNRTGAKHSPEARAKMSAAAKKRRK